MTRCLECRAVNEVDRATWRNTPGLIVRGTKTAVTCCLTQSNFMVIDLVIRKMQTLSEKKELLVLPDLLPLSPLFPCVYVCVCVCVSLECMND